MSNLSFIPQAAASKPAQDFQHASLSERKTEFGESSFDQFLKSANENQAKINSFREKTTQNKSVDKAKQEPKRDEYKAVEEPRSKKVESQPKPEQEAASEKRTKEASQPQAQNTEKEKFAAEVNGEEQPEETAANDGQAELLALLAHLAEAEAVIRGETQPETVQMVELAEAMADSDPVEAIQATDVRAETDGANIAAANMTGADAEGRILNAVESELISANSGLNDLSPNTEGAAEKSIEAKTAGLEQFSQVMSQVSNNQSHTEGESLANQGRNDGKGHISESVKISHNSNIGPEGQTFNKAVFTGTTLSEKTETGVLVGENPGLVQQDQIEAKSGKVNLAVIQTQLAVKDIPEVKTEIPVLGIMPSQPSVSNLSQAQVSGSAEVNSTNREELFAQIVEHAKVVVNNSGSEMEVNLRPEHLGKLQLKVTIENEVVTAKFVAESQQVKEIIENNLGQLKRNLQENGMQVDAIMVSVGNQQGNQEFDQAAYNREGSNNFQSTARDESDDSAFEALKPAPVAERDTVVDLIA